MGISAENTKLTTNNTSGINKEIKVNGQKLETVTSLKYLGSVVSDEDSRPEILCRIALKTAAVTRLKQVWNDRSISLSSKIRLVLSLVTSTFLFACESWTLTADLRRRIRAMEMKGSHKILRFSYERVQQAIGPREDLIMVKRRKLKLYGHVSRSSGLAKTILQGTVKGEKRQRTQTKSWEDYIGKWTGLEFAKSQRAVENREKWKKKLILKLSVVPKRSPRSRDR